MPANIKDPKSGTDYFTAAKQLIQSAQNAHIDSSADPSAYSGLAPIPYWENLFPDAAGDGLSATQRMAYAFNSVAPDWVTALYGIDEFCDPACSNLGAFAFFTPQYDTLAMQSTIGRSSYDALQVSLRKRCSTRSDINSGACWHRSVSTTRSQPQKCKCGAPGCVPALTDQRR